MAQDSDVLAEPGMDPPPAIGGDERRMHVRAYSFWAGLLAGRTFPSIADLNPATIGDFGAHGVLLDFSASHADPAIPWLGEALRAEGGHGPAIRHLADVPGRSLLSRLTDHYLEVVANRAPIGFEAEFINIRGNHALYRGILMPFSSDGTTIDYIYGVINWKEVADAGLVAGIVAQVAQAPAPPMRLAPALSAWADGPSRAREGTAGDPDAALNSLIAAAREGVDLARSTEARALTALFRALGLAYDALLAMPAPVSRRRSGRASAPPPMRRADATAMVRRVFGPDETRLRCAAYASVLCHGLRTGVGAGGLRMLLERHPQGLQGVVADERRARKAQAAAAQS